MEKSHIEKIVKEALAEDIGSGDITSKFSVPENTKASFELISKQDMVLCGREFFEIAFKELDQEISLEFFFKDGDKISSNQIIVKGSGDARAILAAERVALNLMQYMSGIATKTSKFVELIKDSKAKILDTRKILPFYREAAKYAVTVGGGTNHRMRLDDQILIKDNHIAAAGSVAKAIEQCKDSFVRVEIECESLKQVEEALPHKPDIIMLDNMSLEQLKESVELIAGQVKTEASGNVSLANVEEIAQTGIDYISVGALTHSVDACDISLKLNISE